MQTGNAGRQSLDTAQTRGAFPTVFIVHDDPSECESIALPMQTEGWLVESFLSADDFLAHPRAVTPNCLILDISVPQRDGLAFQEIIADRTETPFIFVTTYRDTQLAARAMKAGAVELLTKPVSSAAMLSAVRSALDRSRHALAQVAAEHVLKDRYASLSGREREVLGLVVSGFLNKQIGAELGISEITVKAHRGKVMRKMLAHSLPELVNMVARLGPSAAIDRSARPWRWLAIRNEVAFAH